MAQGDKPTESGQPQPAEIKVDDRKNRGKAKIAVTVEFDLDEASVFNLRGGGIKTVTVVEN